MKRIKCRSATVSCLGVFLFGLLVTIGFFSVAPESLLAKPCGDCEGGYIIPAKNLIAGNGWVDENSQLSTARPPGHATILAGVLLAADKTGIPQKYMFQAFNIIIMASSATILFLLAGCFWDQKSSFVVATLWITSPFTLWFLNQPYSEIPFTLLYFLTIFATIHVIRTEDTSTGWWVLIVGLLSGAAMMVRPFSIGAPLIISLSFILMPKRASGVGAWTQVAKRVAILILGVALMTAPWSIFVHQQTGKWMFLTDGELTQNSIVNGVTFATRGEDYRKPIYLPSGARHLMESIDNAVVLKRQESRPKAAKITSTELLNLIAIEAAKEKLGAFQLVGMKILRAWFGTDSHTYEASAATLIVFYGLLILGGFIGALRQRLVSIPVAALLVGLTLYFWSLSVLFEPLVRYMVPHLGLLFVVIPGLWRPNSNKNQILGRASH